MKIVVVSGGFDPLHSGHIAYFQEAKKRGDKLIVALNSDSWLKKKKNKYLLPFKERKCIIENLNFVDEVIGFEDDDIGSCINALKLVKNMFPNDEIYFANGGDRTNSNIPEMSLNDINFIFGIGGDNKINSSSWILKDWQYSKEKRIWGCFYNLFEKEHVKVKELIVHPGKGMSFQRHFKRNEIWLVSDGACIVNFSKDNPDIQESKKLNTFDKYFVPIGEWHQITNPFKERCHIIEIQYGEECIEEDIERTEYYQ